MTPTAEPTAPDERASTAEPAQPGASVALEQVGRDEETAAEETRTTADETRRVAARADLLATALDEAQGLIDADAASAVAAVLDRVRGRLAVGAEHTVVAIMGGTGSGKSSLFNAVTGLDFADVGDTRPTTERATACVWGSDGAAVLDWLGVDPFRRIRRESLLDAGAEDCLAGLVLLDLPDHDSVATAHRAAVDQALPLADLVIWVVDPQKYADDALHTGYLRELRDREGSMLVALNQIDTVPTEYREALVDDLSRLLAEDGLEEIGVLAVSARTGEGVAELREGLVEVVCRRSAATVHVGDEIAAAAQTLAEALGPRADPPEGDPLEPVVETLVTAAGLQAVADAVGSALLGRGSRSPGFGRVHEDGAQLARTQWLAGATEGLTSVVADEVAARVAGVDDLRQAVADALAGLTVGLRRSVAVRVAFWVGVLLAVGGAAVVLGAVAAAGASWVPRATVGGGLLVAAALVLVGAWWWRRLAARRRARVLAERGRQAVRAVVVTLLSDPTADVLSRLARLQETVAKAR
ncbi:MAG: 50S ribosome-binding GTPase [Micrococcales bacterium]|nr:50S ribosome-binding GTPase [Micrococcales bacterium]